MLPFSLLGCLLWGWIRDILPFLSSPPSIQHKEIYQQTTLTGPPVKNLSISHTGSSSELPFQDKGEIKLISCTREFLAYISGEKEVLFESMFPNPNLAPWKSTFPISHKRKILAGSHSLEDTVHFMPTINRCQISTYVDIQAGNIYWWPRNKHGNY